MKCRSEQRWLMALLAVSLLGAVMIGVIVATAPTMKDVSLNLPPAPSTHAGPVSQSDVDAFALDRQAWSRVQWARPATPIVAPETPTAPAKVRDVRVVAVLPRNGRLVAALTPGPNLPPVYLGVGDEQDGIRIEEVSARVVTAWVDGVQRRLEIRP